jgi:hypothetical protein
VQKICNRPDTKATPFERGLNIESVERVMERRLHSSPSGRTQLPLGRGLEKSKTNSFYVF